ncbi:hypothetical protein PR048_009378 [Dryococelus australis]|uniref:F-box domain-containing protein n=1 Tax=Dryococelus australis TaxID=614101 RepID=A0ABQ9HZQ4_9NEOP|nr:hypothetical protein PR048_009378 [Dryococelus australis]
MFCGEGDMSIGGGIECLVDEMLGRIFRQLPVAERGLLAFVSRQFQRGCWSRTCEDAYELLACVAKHTRRLMSLTELVCRVLRRCGRLRRLVSLDHQLRGCKMVQEIGWRRRSGALRHATVQVSLKHEAAYVPARSAPVTPTCAHVTPIFTQFLGVNYLSRYNRRSLNRSDSS